MFSCPRRAHGGVRAPQGRRPGSRRVRRRRLRRQAGRRLRGAGRSRARADHRPAGAARQRPPRRAARRRPPRRDAADRAARRNRATARSPRSRPTRSSRVGQGGWLMPVLIPARTLYRCADVRALTFLAKTNLRAQNAFRAPGVMEGTAAFEQAMDELALALGIDPLELRRRNHTDVDQVSGLPYSSKHLLACYDRAAELAGWEQRDALREPQADGLLRGMGCATQIWWGGGGPPSHATVRLDAEGHAHVVTGIQDIGTGTLTGRADRGGRGARAAARRRSRHRRRHRPERLRPGRGRLADDAVGDARGALGLGEGAQDAAPAGQRRVRDRRRRSRGARRPDPLARRRHRRRRDGGDGEARQRDDRRLRLARPEPGRLRGQHVRLPDRAGRGRSRRSARCASSGSSPSTTSAGSSTR